MWKGKPVLGINTNFAFTCKSCPHMMFNYNDNVTGICNFKHIYTHVDCTCDNVKINKKSRSIVGKISFLKKALREDSRVCIVEEIEDDYI